MSNNKPAASKPVAAPANCACGCGQPAITAKATFLSGHDARLAGVLGRAKATGSLTSAQVKQYESLSDRLKAKVDAIEATARKRAAEKAAREEARKVAKEAYAAAMAKVAV